MKRSSTALADQKTRQALISGFITGFFIKMRNENNTMLRAREVDFVTDEHGDYKFETIVRTEVGSFKVVVYPEDITIEEDP